jgi:outer membrane protein assembly factor BamB
LAEERDAAAKVEASWRLDFTEHGPGMVVSSPALAGDRAFVSVAHVRGTDKYGVLYCVDLKAQKILWKFDDDGDMKQVFSSPCLADGRVYCGEGFHDDNECKLYCVDAKTGKKLWEFKTESQTESSPCVAGGKVFFGAGNEGVYALDAATGKKLWQFPEKKGQQILRFGANPTVAGNRLYVGSGVDRNHPENPGETAVFCVDTDTGKLVWKVPVNLPCWAGAVAAGDQVFFALGNGDVFTDEKKGPAGAVLCLRAATGKQVWRKDVPNGVLESPAVDRGAVYFGARDGCCYCLNRYNGEQRWKQVLGSPVLASPALDQGSTDGRSASVFVASFAGRLACLDAATGKMLWGEYKLERPGTVLISSPRVAVTASADGERRQVYFGVGLGDRAIPALGCVEDFFSR